MSLFSPRIAGTIKESSCRNEPPPLKEALFVLALLHSSIAMARLLAPNTMRLLKMNSSLQQLLRVKTKRTDQPHKRPVVQSHGITLSFHREIADSSRELVGPDVSAAVSFESYPRFIKGGFQDYEGLGIKRSTADSKHVPSPHDRGC
jgi:hypothetical protein